AHARAVRPRLPGVERAGRRTHIDKKRSVRIVDAVLDARHLTRRSFLGGGLASVGATLLPARASRAAVADLDFASALEVARAIRRGDVSSVELKTRILDRIARQIPRHTHIVTMLLHDAPTRAHAVTHAR